MSKAQCVQFAHLEKLSLEAEAELFGVLQTRAFQHQDDLSRFEDNADSYRQVLESHRFELQAHIADCSECKAD
jgi:hypothetical protein